MQLLGDEPPQNVLPVVNCFYQEIIDVFKQIPNIGILMMNKIILSILCVMVKFSTCSHSIHFMTENTDRFFSANVQGEK